MISEFKDRLQLLIDIKNISQAAFAKGIGAGESNVSDWLNGVTKAPQRKTLRKIADYFGCDINWLATGTGEPFSQSPAQQQDDIMRDRLIVPLPETDSKNDDNNTSIPEALDMTKEVLESKTVYRSALMSNIKAFHKAVKDEDEMKGMREEMQDIKKMLAILLERTAVEPEQKRESQAG